MFYISAGLIIVFGEGNSNFDASMIIRSGGRGLLKFPQDLPYALKAINTVVQGGLWFQRDLIEKELLYNMNTQPNQIDENLHREYIFHNLTEKEKYVATLVVEGLRNKDIADKLNISEKTVKLHLTKIYRKLDVTGRVQLLLFAKNM